MDHPPHPPTNGKYHTYSPITMVTNQYLDYWKKIRVESGAYVEAY